MREDMFANYFFVGNVELLDFTVVELSPLYITLYCIIKQDEHLKSFIDFLAPLKKTHNILKSLYNAKCTVLLLVTANSTWIWVINGPCETNYSLSF